MAAWLGMTFDVERAMKPESSIHSRNERDSIMSFLSETKVDMVADNEPYHAQKYFANLILYNLSFTENIIYAFIHVENN